MNERVEYTYAYFMHIINVWVSGVSHPPSPPHFFVGVSSLDRVESCDHNQHKSFTLVILSDNTIVYYRVVNWTDCH